jgi:hypothetical protein
MLRDGVIIRIKKGLYVLSPDFGGHIHLPEIANALYGPSYISLEFALSYYSLIPERVIEITSVTLKGENFFKTPLGNFSFIHIKKKAFAAGIQLVENGEGRYLIASKEKMRQTQIKSAFIKAQTMQNLLYIEAPANTLSSLNPAGVLKIKIEIDIDPPPFAEYEVKTLLVPIPHQVKLYSLADLFAGKIHAVLCRVPG